MSVRTIRSLRYGIAALAVVVAFSACLSGAGAAGGSWSVLPTPEPQRSTHGVLSDVACRTATNCVAVGTYVHGTWKGLIERWDGQTWVLMLPRNYDGFTYSTLRGVSCPTTRSCFAVGAYGRIDAYYTLIEHWDGSSWSLMPSPTGAGDIYKDSLEDVACPTPQRCFAVGNSGHASGPKIIERWNGTRWTVMADDSLRPSTYAELYDVTCPSAHICIAVGGYASAHAEALCPLVERWSHGTWKSMSGVPCAKGSESRLKGVACTMLSACFAVGFDGTDPILLHWSGHGAWTEQPAPDPAGRGGYTHLDDVTCTDADSCVVVGAYIRRQDSHYRPLAARWDGATWTPETLPASPPYATLGGVACSGDSQCQAVGSRIRDSDGRTHALVERYG